MEDDIATAFGKLEAGYDVISMNTDTILTYGIRRISAVQNVDVPPLFIWVSKNSDDLRLSLTGRDLDYLVGLKNHRKLLKRPSWDLNPDLPTY